jgi:hypothetical protein
MLLIKQTASLISNKAKRRYNKVDNILNLRIKILNDFNRNYSKLRTFLA